MVKRRGDFRATHQYKGFKLCPGKPLPFGATVLANGVNFSIYSSYADSCELVLFRKGEKEPFIEIPFFKYFKIGNVFTMMVLDLEYDDIEYGFRMDGLFDIKNGHWFDKKRILMDPYSKIVNGINVWGERDKDLGDYKYRSQILFEDFNWDDDVPLETPVEDLIIYEMHVRGFTNHISSGVAAPGTFIGIKEKIPHLKKLGVNCIELMPIHEFDELENFRVSPGTGEKLKNYWGYSNLGFFAPKAGYAASGKDGGQVNEFKSLVRDLHANGIEVFLDVVFNHTAEGNEKGPYISYRGIDNKTYYLLTPDGKYYNFSGCGNTLNCNHPVVRDMIVNCLRYWASEYHIDGFRFDLASILGRDQEGVPMASPPLIEALAFDPILGKCKLIAEAWDAAGLYQVGSFPAWGRWAEWNGKFRDDIRKFIKSDMGMAKLAALRIEGSPDLYKSNNRGTKASVNFITAHDGFTLRDLVSYNEKHNFDNAENDTDGDNNNNSWNCGTE
ncbi:MAG: alpha-amylase family glycosyl hydrolase, partial [Candidatus Omnitrophota bacterium]